MIDQEKRQAIYLLYKQGISKKSIARQLSMNLKTVKAIIKQKGEMPQSVRRDKIEIDEMLLRRLYSECEGFVQRVYEKLNEEEGISVSYSTLTRLLHEKGISEEKNQRCDKVDDEPGAEMQHDTSLYKIKIGEHLLKVVASILYFRYSKVRYLKFYRLFNRFTMKCFFHEALTFFNYCAPECIIDNTNLARLSGTGKNAVIVPEMEIFAGNYGFKFRCHSIGHANRKAGNERCFYTVETNFFPGRTFSSLADLNEQSLKWATITFASRPLSKIHSIPLNLFEYEKPYLKKLQPFVPKPYVDHERTLDQYGYASFDGNYYWVPGAKRFDVKLLQYSDCLEAYHKRELLAEFSLPPFGVKNERIFPKDGQKPTHQPKNRTKPTNEEETRLRGISEEVNSYLDFLIKEKDFKSKHRAIRKLASLSLKVAPSLFIKAICRAHKYRIVNPDKVDRIVTLLLREASIESPIARIDYDFYKRESFLEGCHSEKIDLSIYDKALEDNDE